MVRILFGLLISFLTLLYLPVWGQNRNLTPQSVTQSSRNGSARGQNPVDGKMANGLRLKKVIRGDIRPKSIVYSGNGRFFAQNMMYRHSITVYDRNYNQIKTISDKVNLSDFNLRGYGGTASGAPVEVAFSSDGQYAWVSNYSMSGKGFDNPGNDNCDISKDYDKSFVYKINTRTLEIENIVEVGCVPKYLAVSPDNRILLVTNWCSGDLSIVDLNSETEIKRIPLGRYPRGIAIDSKGRNAYISVMGEDKIAILKLTDGSVSWIDDVGDTPRHLVLGPDDRFLYLTLDREGLVRKYDLVRGRMAGEAESGLSPRSMVLSSEGKYLYVANYRDNSLSKVATESMTVKETVETHEKPIGITFDPITKSIWLACYTGSIMVFEDQELLASQNAPLANNLGTESEGDNGLTYVPGTGNTKGDPNYYLYREEGNNPNTNPPNTNPPRPQRARSVPPRTYGPQNVQFHIIVGSFSSKQSAERKVRELKTRGIQAEVIRSEGGQYRVSAKTLNSQGAADAEMANVKRKYKMDAWVWRRQL
ncbi:MAG: cytochrome D1 domain-containing protein [Bacteroidota bacterium]